MIRKRFFTPLVAVTALAVAALTLRSAASSTPVPSASGGGGMAIYHASERGEPRAPEIAKLAAGWAKYPKGERTSQVGDEFGLTAQGLSTYQASEHNQVDAAVIGAGGLKR